MRARLLAAASALALLGGCASTILLESEPPGARVVVDGAYLGRAPVRYTDTAPVGTVHRVDLYLQGYDDLHGSFARNGPIDPGAVCGGLVCLVPLAWVQDYPRSRRFLMRQVGAGDRGQGSPGQQGGDQGVPPPYPGWKPAVPGQGAPAPTPPPDPGQPPRPDRAAPTDDGLPPPPLPPGTPPPGTPAPLDAPGP